MGFTAIPVASGSPTQGYSTPDRVSFCVQDDGGGGQIVVNGLGITSSTVTGAVDLKTLFGTAFRSLPLLRAFQPIATDLAGCTQFNTYLNITSHFQSGVGVAGDIGFINLRGLSSGPSTVPYLGIAGPSIAGIWRVDLQLRHSLPG